jgi:toxin ParE1/3/4
MMAAFKVSQKAYSDLLEIGRYTEKEWGRLKRLDYLQEINQCFLQIADTPETGSTCNDIRPGYRKFPKASHVIFYMQGDDGTVEIIRVLHKSMDIEAKLDNE